MGMLWAKGSSDLASYHDADGEVTVDFLKGNV
jgi:hypothetical protein